MRATRPGFLILALAVAMAAVSPLPADAPDCTGISGVFNTDPDLLGELIGIRVASGLSDPVGDPLRVDPRRRGGLHLSRTALTCRHSDRGAGHHDDRRDAGIRRNRTRRRNHRRENLVLESLEIASRSAL